MLFEIHLELQTIYWTLFEVASFSAHRTTSACNLEKNHLAAIIWQITEFGSKYLKSSPFFVEEAMPLEQGGGEGKPDVESWMPLEHAATVTHPPVIQSKTKC